MIPAGTLGPQDLRALSGVCRGLGWCSPPPGEAIGFPHPVFWGYFVGSFETVCGLLILLGLLTRLAAVPTFVIMVVALLTTKVPVLLGHGFGPFTVRELSRYGFFGFTHEARTDLSMLLGSLFLMVAGGGAWSVDALLEARRNPAGAGAGAGSSGSRDG